MVFIIYFIGHTNESEMEGTNPVAIVKDVLKFSKELSDCFGINAGEATCTK